MTIIPSIMDQDDDYRPRYLVLSKMEKIIKEMQNADTGIPVRCQKNFLTTIPCAFTGYDLVEWLMDRLDLEDGLEALHLATLFCSYGYFFPVTDTKNLTVKDDSTLYRFQSPYFWPSQNWDPDNIEYAIYLAKRSMRNKQKHGLEDHEQAAFNKLQKMLCDKWDFVYMQAEEQVRLAKERKKADKVVLDSQERAFWRVHRPAPGQMKCLEEGVRRNFRPSQMSHRRKKNVEGYRKEIEFLHRKLKQPKMKASKAVESLIQRCEQFEEHDAFLSPAQPSNPWVSDDTTMWLLNTVIVTTPTERRVKRWGFSLDELLADETGTREFELYLEKEFSAENIHFWAAVEELRRRPLSSVADKVNAIYRDYLAAGAPYEINIDSKTMDQTLSNMKKPNRYTFDPAQKHIFTLMKKDSYPRFLRSDHYKNVQATAINPCPKKKFGFSFGVKKKSPVPSPKAKRRGSAEGVNDKLMTSGGLSHHSYSTGNLQELDGVDTARSNRSTPYGSTGDLKQDSPENHKVSPKTIRQKLDELIHSSSPTPAGSNNLDVPKGGGHNNHHGAGASGNDTNISVNIAVPSTKRCNVVAPWEDGEG